MPSITAKIIRGKTYYYARECRRVNGKPRITWQKYLGRADDIIDRVLRPHTLDAEAFKAREAILVEFGAVVALYDLACRLRLVEIIDRHVLKGGHGPTVGMYLLIAAINRCVDPCSKAGIGQWFQATALRRLLPVEERQLSSQRFWDNMDRVTPESMAQIERELAVHLVKEFDLDIRRLLLDATNFFTFIDTFNERCTVAQRGKNKEGRKALRIVGLALLVTADFHIPLLHRTYPGNQTDAPTFASLSEDLTARIKDISQTIEQITLVFDKGNNSHENLGAVDEGGYHFIGSLVPTYHPDLLQIPLKKYRSMAGQGFEGVRAYRTTKEVFGARRTILVTYNETLFVTQSQTLLREIAKRQQKLRDLQASLKRRQNGKIHGGKAPSKDDVGKKIAALLKARHMKELLSVRVTAKGRVPDISYRFSHYAWNRLQKTLLGKTIIFTNNHAWSNAEILRGYRGQHQIETAFRTMKDPHHVCLRPQYHWTDQKIAVHVFYCVLALLLCSLLRRQLHIKGIDLSIPAMLDELAKIREVGIVYPPGDGEKQPVIKMTLSRLSPTQRKMFQTLGLSRHLTT
jgi:transposase